MCKNEKVNFSYSADMIFIWDDVRKIYEYIKNNLKKIISKK